MYNILKMWQEQKTKVPIQFFGIPLFTYRRMDQPAAVVKDKLETEGRCSDCEIWGK